MWLSSRQKSGSMTPLQTPFICVAGSQNSRKHKWVLICCEAHRWGVSMSILMERGKGWELPCHSVCITLQAQVGGNLDAFQTPPLWRATGVPQCWHEELHQFSLQPIFLPWEKEIGLKTTDLSAHDWFPWQQSSIASLSRTNQELSARTKDNLIT